MSEIIYYMDTNTGNDVPVAESDLGSGGGVFYINVVDVNTPRKIDKTWNEIKSAYDSGKVILFKESYSNEENFSWTYRHLYYLGVSKVDNENDYFVQEYTTSGSDIIYHSNDPDSELAETPSAH